VGLQDGGHLGVRGGEQAGNLLGQCLIRGKARKLALPQIQITARQRVEFGRVGAVAIFRGHERTIAHRREHAFRKRGAACRTAASGLRSFLGRGEERSVMADQPPPDGGPKPAPVVIKKYANRRLYNTATSAYVTLDHLSQMVKDKTDFVVYDAKTGEDITRPVLTQIIVEEESKGGQTMLPISFLRQLISFYGDSLQGVVPQYLEMSMTQFARNQEQMRSYMQNAFGFNPFQQFESMGKQNMAMFENAMRMFNPFGVAQGPSPGSSPGVPPQANGVASEPPRPQAPAEQDAAIDDLKRKLDELQGQLSELSKKTS
jgi:polyhydroxyalkanoate synthesis repressor PhaR